MTSNQLLRRAWLLLALFLIGLALAALAIEIGWIR